MKTFWTTLPHPFFALAPMEAATDSAFRRIVASCGKPDVFFTEFTSVEGLFSPGKNFTLQRFLYTPSETPLIAQIWGARPENYYKAAQLIEERGFSGIDINMGCPDRSVTKKGLCSALINNPTLAQEIIQATQEGAGKLPVSVKTRIGFNSIKTEEWISFLLEQNLDALTIHARTAKEMSKVANRWEEIKKVVDIKNKMKKKTIIIGNGDIKSYAEGVQKREESGVDGIMIGRGVFHNPWIFDPHVDPHSVPIQEKLQLLKTHIQIFLQTWKDEKDFNQMKRYIKIYISGTPYATDIREKMMRLSKDEILEYIQELDSSFQNQSKPV